MGAETQERIRSMINGPTMAEFYRSVQSELAEAQAEYLKFAARKSLHDGYDRQMQELNDQMAILTGFLEVIKQSRKPDHAFREAKLQLEE